MQAPSRSWWLQPEWYVMVGAKSAVDVVMVVVEMVMVLVVMVAGLVVLVTGNSRWHRQCHLAMEMTTAVSSFVAEVGHDEVEGAH